MAGNSVINQWTLKLLFILAILFQSHAHSAVDMIIGEQKLIAHKPWPSKARKPIELALHHTKADNEEVVRLVFNCNNYYFQLSFDGDWKKTTTTPSRYSCQLHNYENHNFTFSISEFEKDEFLKSLDEEEWLGYKKYLTRRFPKTEIYFEEDSEHATDKQIIVFSKRYRQIAYTYRSTKNKLVRAREIFVFLDETLYVFTFSGPAEVFDNHWKKHSFYISRMFLKLKTAPKQKIGYIK